MKTVGREISKTLGGWHGYISNLLFNKKLLYCVGTKMVCLKVSYNCMNIYPFDSRQAGLSIVNLGYNAQKLNSVD